LKKPPTTLDRYIKTVNELTKTMADHTGAEDDRGSLVSNLRALVRSVVVHPKGPREGFEVEVKGKLAALIGGELFPQTHCSGSRVVAGDDGGRAQNHPRPQRRCARSCPCVGQYGSLPAVVRRINARAKIINVHGYPVATN
jgi:hypothetical protein